MTEEEFVNPEDLAHKLRMKVIKEYGEKHPILGQFSAEEYATDKGKTMGSVFVPEWKRGGMPFTNLKSKHVKVMLKAFWAAEIQACAREHRVVTIDGLMAYFEWELAELNGWLARMYLETGIAGLQQRPPLTRKERRLRKKQGGW